MTAVRAPTRRPGSFRLAVVLILLTVLGAQILAMPLPVGAQGKSGTLRGSVLDEDGKGVGGVSITITNGRWSAQAVTNGDGEFELGNLLEANYTVRADPPGGYRVTGGAATARISGSATVRTDFRLARLNPTARPSATATPGERDARDVPAGTPTVPPGQRDAREVPAGTPTTGTATPSPGPRDRRDELASPGPTASASRTPGPTASGPLFPVDRALPGASPVAVGTSTPTATGEAPAGGPSAGPGDASAGDGGTTATSPPPRSRAPRFGGVAATRSRPGPPSWPRNPAPIEASKLDEYLKAHGSPLAGLGETILDAGWRYNVDPRLLVAIAGAETGFGRIECTDFNAWNWFWFEWCNSPFESSKQAIDEVARGLRMYYLDGGWTDVDAIADRYCPLDDPRDTLGVNRYWPANVKRALEDLGGNRCNLSWVQTNNPCGATRPTPTTRPVAPPRPDRVPVAVQAESEAALEGSDDLPWETIRSVSFAGLRFTAPADRDDWARVPQVSEAVASARPAASAARDTWWSQPLDQRGSQEQRVLPHPVDDLGYAAVPAPAPAPVPVPVPVMPPPPEPIAAEASPTTDADPEPEAVEVQVQGTETTWIGQMAPRDLLAVALLVVLIVSARALHLLGPAGRVATARRVLSWLRGRAAAGRWS